MSTKAIHFTRRPQGGHRHKWQKGTKQVKNWGLVLYVHVCMDHEDPYMVPYDMRITEPAFAEGRSWLLEHYPQFAATEKVKEILN